MSIPRFIILCMPLALMACVDPVMPPEGPLPNEAACGADQLQELVGQRASRLETIRFSGPVRVIRPGEAVTMDYLPNRLNIYIDDYERITDVRCG